MIRAQRIRRTMARCVIVLGSLIALSYTGVGTTIAQAAPLPELDACDLLSGSVMLGPLCDIGSGVADAAEGVSDAVDFLNDPSSYILEAAGSYFGAVNSFLGDTGTVNFTIPNVLALYGLMCGISLVLAVFQVIRTITLSGNLAAQFHAIPGFTLYMVSLFLGPVAMYYLLQGVDYASAPITDLAGAQLTTFLSTLTTMTTDYLGGLGIASSFVGLIVIAVLYLIGGAVIWLELILRAAIIYALFVFFPIFAVGLIQPKGADSTGRIRLAKFIDIFVGIAVTKFVIVVILALAAALATGGGAQGLAISLALILLSVFAIFAVLALFPAAEGALAASGATNSLSRIGRSAGRGARRIIGR